LSGQVAVVTGSNTGIGEQTAIALATAGAHVVLARR
jgi:NAD(P)-dependent dehydrogenase (short-subunit alcohol dehydrogenase family)